MVVLITHHGAELAPINFQLFYFVCVGIEASCHFFTQINYFAVLHSPRLAHELFIFFHLAANLVEPDHKTNSFAAYFNNVVIEA